MSVSRKRDCTRLTDTCCYRMVTSQKIIKKRKESAGVSRRLKRESVKSKSKSMLDKSTVNLKNARSRPKIDQVNGKKIKNEGKSMKKSVLRKSPRNTETKEHVDGENETVATSKTVKSQKRKRADSVGEDGGTTDCFDSNNLSKEHVLQCMRAIFRLTEEQLKTKNALFAGESQPLFMQVTCIRVPRTPRRCMRIVLPHSIVSENDEVALFVGDLTRGRRRDYTPTVEHYEDLLHKHGCTRVKSVIPMNQVKTEYDQYELKRKLVDSYDYFLIDGKIAGHLSHLLGSEFYKKRKLPTPIRMQSKDLKHEIEHGLKKTLMPIHSDGDTHIVQVGHSGMKDEEIFDNVLATCTYLSKHYPGGWANVRSVRLKTRTSLGLPIYTTLKSKNSVQVPMVRPKRPKAYRQVSGEISTVASLNSVTVTPEGDVIVQETGRRYRKRKTEQNK